MCLVETGTKNKDTGEISMLPKLVPACQTPAKDGTVFVTNSEKVRANQNFVEEDLLLDHPVDCPICDKAGECWLQDSAVFFFFFLLPVTSLSYVLLGAFYQEERNSRIEVVNVYPVRLTGKWKAALWQIVFSMVKPAQSRKYKLHYQIIHHVQ